MDYGSTVYEVALSARNAEQRVAPYFFTLFVLSKSSGRFISVIVLVTIITVKDPLTYIVIVVLMLSFFAFIAGTYLVDYGSTHDVALSARNTIQV